MKQYIGCDAHKQYSVFVAVNEAGQASPALRVEHDRAEFAAFLHDLPPGSPIALETTGSWYWMVEAMEQAGHHPLLVHAGEAKKRMGKPNKTDKLDAKGLAILLRNGTAPSVWIAPSAIRDQRELPRTRMVLVRMRTSLKNRIHAAFAKYGIGLEGASDLFVGKGRRLLEEHLTELPAETQRAVREQLKLLDVIEAELAELERRIREVVAETPAMQWLRTLPGVGPILAIVIALEVGDVARFPEAEHLASYAGTVPRVHESGGHGWHGRVRADVNRYLKWAYVEAANVVVLNQERWAERHVVELYQRLHKHKGHPQAIVAVGRHLAEATYWVLKKQEPYREPPRRGRGVTGA